MTDFSDLFRRQAEWQESLRHLPWPEMLRMAAGVRDSAVKLSQLRPLAASATKAAQADLKSPPDTRKGSQE